ncbi:unnamed protein product [marine sediment metagenome]|uniref:DNA helicase DnaB-like N-terminal domain-containing protein n=1 Tax=marine sediment metagenome TaxID=412755 RepID=X1RAW2_9ZZZZ
MKKQEEAKNHYNTEYERDVLGCILAKPERLSTAKTVLGKAGAEAFYHLDAQEIYKACLELEAKNEVIGITTVNEVLKRKGKVVKQKKGKALDLDALEKLTTYAIESNILFEQELKKIREYALHRKVLTLFATGQKETLAEIYKDFEDLIEERQEISDRAKDEKPLSIAEIIEKGVPEIRCLVGEGLLPCEGYAMICGKAKQRKTTLALYLSLCLATKTNVFVKKDGGKEYAFPTLKKAKTLYLYGEAQVGFVMSLFTSLIKGFKARGREITEEELNSVKIKRNRDVVLDTEEGLTALRKLLKIERWDMVIIDPLTLFMSGDIDKGQSALVVINALQKLSQEFHCLFLLVHHGRKDRAEKGESVDKMDSILGSSTLRNNYESCIFIERWSESKGDMIKQCTFEFRNAAIPDPLIIKLDPDTFLPEPKSKAEAVSLAVVDVFQLRDLINESFNGAGFPTEVVALASEYFDVSSTRIYNLLAEGKVRGLFEKEKGKGGKWVVAGESEEKREK